MSRYSHCGVVAGSSSRAGGMTTALRGIAVGADGALLAAGDSKVVVFEPDGPVRQSWATHGAAQCGAVGEDGTVAVGVPGAIEFFAGDGRSIERWTKPDEIRLPTSIAIRGGDVLVGDARFRCVRRFDRGGRWRNDFGAEPPASGFRICNGHLDLAIDAGGVVYVADPGRHRVTSFSMQGERLGHFGRFDGSNPAGFSGCCNPTNLAILPSGEIVTVSKAPVAIKLFRPDGSLDCELASEAFDPCCKNCDVAVGADGRIYVVDTVWREIHVFAPQRSPARAVEV